MRRVSSVECFGWCFSFRLSFVYFDPLAAEVKRLTAEQKAMVQALSSPNQIDVQALRGLSRIVKVRSGESSTEPLTVVSRIQDWGIVPILILTCLHNIYIYNLYIR